MVAAASLAAIGGSAVHVYWRYFQPRRVAVALGEQRDGGFLVSFGKTPLWEEWAKTGIPDDLAFMRNATNVGSPADLVFVDRDDPRLAERGIEADSNVIGYEHNGEAKAYPIRVFAELVNDTVGGQAVCVAY